MIAKGMLVILVMAQLSDIAASLQKQSSEARPLPQSQSTSEITKQSTDAVDPSSYYDARERISASYTFVWRGEWNSFISRERVERLKKDSELFGVQTVYGEGVFEMGDGTLLVTGLECVYTIMRTPRLALFDRQHETALTSSEYVGKTTDISQALTYYLGGTGEVMVAYKPVLRLVDVFDFGSSGAGLYSPTFGAYLGEMIFLGGFSPLRLIGAELADWQLVKVDEQEWVFEITPEKIKERKLEKRLPGVERVRVHLNRLKGDAPSRAEIVCDYGTTLWETQEYQLVQNVWVPSKVLFQWIDGRSTIFTLESSKPTKGAVPIAIPFGTPVRDWRWVKREDVIEAAMSAPFSIEVAADDDSTGQFSPPPYVLSEWSPELLQSLWRTVSSSRREPHPSK